MGERVGHLATLWGELERELQRECMTLKNTNDDLKRLKSKLEITVDVFQQEARSKEPLGEKISCYEQQLQEKAQHILLLEASLQSVSGTGQSVFSHVFVIFV